MGISPPVLPALNFTHSLLFTVKTLLNPSLILKFHGGKPRLGLEPSVPCNYGIPGAEQPFQSFQLALGVRIPCCRMERAAPQSPGSLECRLGTFGIIPNPSPASWPCWRQKLPAGAAAPSPTPESPSPALPGVSFHFHPVMGALETLGILRTPEKWEEWELSSGSAATPEYSKGSSPSGAVFLKYFSVDPQQFWQETPPISDLFQTQPRLLGSPRRGKVWKTWKWQNFSWQSSGFSWSEDFSSFQLMLQLEWIKGNCLAGKGLKAL